CHANVIHLKQCDAKMPPANPETVSGSDGKQAEELKDMTLKFTIPCVLTVLLLAASGAAAADVDVYGKANISVQDTDEAGVSEVELKSNASRFGVKGNEDLGDGLKVIYQFEWGVNPDSSGDNISARNQFVGLAGSFGTLKVGRNDTALKTAQGDFDLFNDLSGDIGSILNGEN